ncbi:MAG: hypothetical protein K9I68_02480 [Bacteroidales bacterium]|nr:hypothetical protein [Bacteroidales bacterium]MCF8337180.1 hypothetical protein [Bacteroidales bacterium]
MYLTDDQKRQLDEKLKNLTDNEIYELVENYVSQEAEKELNEMCQEEFENLPEPAPILFNENWEQRVIREFKQSYGVRNNIFKIEPRLATESPLIDKWVDYKIWQLREPSQQQNKTPEPKPQQKDSIGEKTKQLIENHFDSMDKTGWEYAFNTENDYRTIVDLLTKFFTYKHYILPGKTIRLKRNCKTRLGETFGEIHKKLSENSLQSDIKFFEIVRIMNHFKDESNMSLYKIMTR